MATALEVPKKPAESEALEVRTPMDLITQALAQGISAEQLKILQEMHFRQLDRQAEIEFDEALNRVQLKIPIVVPDLYNEQTRSRYPSPVAIDKATRPLYAAEGFSLSFTTEDSPKPEHVRMVGVLRRGGHKERYQMDIPADGKGAKGGDVMTKVHAAGAANTYGKRYLICDIFNIPIGEDNDGNSMEVPEATKKAFEAAKSYQELDKVFRDAFKEANTGMKQALITLKNRCANAMRETKLDPACASPKLDWGKR